MHSFYSGDRTAGGPKGFETQHGMRKPFHGPMILFHDGIEIFRVAEDNCGLVRLVVVRDRCRIGATFHQQFLRAQQRPAF
jgi:hypothetical protein